MILAVDESGGGLALVGAALALVVIALTLLRRRQFPTAGARERRSRAREQHATLREQRELREGLDRLLAELERVQRDINAQLEAKLPRLDAAIRAADQRIAALRAAGAADGEWEAALTQQQGDGPGIRPADESVRGGRRDRRRARELRTAEARRATSAGRGAEAAARRQPVAVAATDPVALEAARLARPAPPLNPLHQRVYDLADAGKSLMQLAEQLEMPLGEVELILNLRSLR